MVFRRVLVLRLKGRRTRAYDIVTNCETPPGRVWLKAKAMSLARAEGVSEDQLAIARFEIVDPAYIEAHPLPLRKPRKLHLL